LRPEPRPDKPICDASGFSCRSENYFHAPFDPVALFRRFFLSLLFLSPTISWLSFSPERAPLLVALFIDVPPETGVPRKRRSRLPHPEANYNFFSF
jgi:hypothetical protein